MRKRNCTMQSIVSSIILGCWPISLDFKIKRNNQIEWRKSYSNVKWALVMILQKPKAGHISYLPRLALGVQRKYTHEWKIVIND